MVSLLYPIQLKVWLWLLDLACINTLGYNDFATIYIRNVPKRRRKKHRLRKLPRLFYLYTCFRVGKSSHLLCVDNAKTGRNKQGRDVVFFLDYKRQQQLY
jgi:hypothetical protein